MAVKQAAAAGAAAFVAPFLIGILVEAPSPEEPPTQTQTQTVELALEAPKWQRDGAHAFGLLVPEGAMPSNVPLTLSDSSGANLAVLDLDDDACVGDDTYSSRFANSTDRLCIQIEGLRAGSEVSGKLTFPEVAENTKGVVAVEISSRHNFVGVPLIVSVLGLLAGFVATAFVPRLRRRNEEAAIAAVAERAVGADGKPSPELAATLRAWSAVARAEGVDGPTRIKVLTRLAAEAAQDAAIARRALEAALAAAPDLPDGRHVVPAAVRQAAAAEAARTTLVWSHFVDRKGEVAEHPARRSAADIDRFAELGHQLAQHEDRFAHSSEPVDQLLDLARTTFDASKSPDAERLEGYLASVRQAVGASVREPMGAVAPKAFVLRGGPPPAPKAPGRTWELMALNGLVIVVAVVAALAALAFGIWEPVATFGTRADYYKLAAAAVAAGGAASWVSLIESWYGPKVDG